MTTHEQFLGNDVPGDLELQRLADSARKAFAWRAQLDTLTAEGSANGVVIEVNGSGALTRLNIEDWACSEGGEAVSTLVIEAFADAQSAVAELVRQSAADTFGEDSSQGDLVEQGLRSRRLPTLLAPEDEPPA